LVSRNVTSWLKPMPGPSRYGAVASMNGPGFSPRWIAFATSSSAKPFMLPPVRMLVTPPARYRREKLSVRLAYVPEPTG
jgi:hypothetical protein